MQRTASEAKPPAFKPTTLARAWKRAEIHADTISWFRTEAANDSPVFGAVKHRILNQYGQGLPKRHQQAIEQELDDLVFAANTVHKLKEHFKDRPNDLFEALYGNKPKHGAQMNDTGVLTLNFTVPPAFYHKYVDTKSVGIFAPRPKVQPYRERESERRAQFIAEALTVTGLTNMSYLHRLASVQNTDDYTTSWHEEDHAVSALVDAHVRRNGQKSFLASENATRTGLDKREINFPPYEEAYAQARETVNWSPAILAETLVKKDKQYPKEMMGRFERVNSLIAHLLQSRQELTAKTRGSPPESKKPTAHGEVVRLALRFNKKLKLPAEIAANGLTNRQVTTALQKARMLREELTETAEYRTIERLQKIQEIQSRYHSQMPSRVVAALLRTHDLRFALAAIQHRAQQFESAKKK